MHILFHHHIVFRVTEEKFDDKLILFCIVLFKTFYLYLEFKNNHGFFFHKHCLGFGKSLKTSDLRLQLRKAVFCYLFNYMKQIKICF